MCPYCCPCLTLCCKSGTQRCGCAAVGEREACPCKVDMRRGSQETLSVRRQTFALVIVDITSGALLFVLFCSMLGCGLFVQVLMPTIKRKCMATSDLPVILASSVALDSGSPLLPVQ